MFEIEPELWREGAACAGLTDVDFFAPPDAADQVARAKAVCDGCAVLGDCLAFAIETNQADGIWGGLTAKERVSLRRCWLEDLRRAS